MPQATITEALAEMKVIGKRIESKRQFIGQYLLRPEQLKDPLEKEGGSVSAISREEQAIRDLEENAIAIRRAIQKANEATNVTVGKGTRTIADWLVWRREVAPQRRSFMEIMRAAIERNRTEALKRGAGATTAEAAKSGDVIVNVNEQELMSQIEDLGAALETLDGQLSLKNATIVIAW